MTPIGRYEQRTSLEKFQDYYSSPFEATAATAAAAAAAAGVNIEKVDSQFWLGKFVFERHSSFTLSLSYLHQCDQKKSPNVYKSCPKMIDFDTFTKIA